MNKGNVLAISFSIVYWRSKKAIVHNLILLSAAQELGNGASLFLLRVTAALQLSYQRFWNSNKEGGRVDEICRMLETVSLFVAASSG